MGNLRALMLDKDFESLSLADQTDVMRQAGAPDELLSEWVSRKATGPTISANTGPSPVGFEDTSGEVASILEQRREPNLPGDVLPKLGMFAAEGALATVPPGVAGAVSKGVQSLRGLSTAAKAGKVAKAGAGLVGEGVGYWVADRALAMAGVPPEYRAMALMAAGYTAHANRARKALGGAAEATAAPVADEAKAAAIAASRARREAAASETVAKARTPVAAPVEPPPAAAPVQSAPAAPVEAPRATQPSPEYTEWLQQELAARRARLAEYDQRVAAERAVLDPQFIADDAVSVVPPREVPMIPDEAVSLVAEPIPPRVRRQPVEGIVIQPPAPRGAPPAPPQATVQPTVQAKGTTTMATNLGGKAKPGPAPTPPDKLEEALQASLKVQDEMHQRAATAGMTEKVAARRREIGADKLARELGMDPDVIRSDAGDIVGEALGAHSPIIPEKAWKQIMAKMLSLPPAERYAYVAKATNWARPQIEQLRRNYEHLGIAIPVAAASGLTLRELAQQGER